MLFGCSTKPETVVQHQVIENKPPAALVRPLPVPADLPEDATNGDLLQRAQEGRLGIREANARFKAIRIYFGMN